MSLVDLGESTASTTTGTGNLDRTVKTGSAVDANLPRICYTRQLTLLITSVMEISENGRPLMGTVGQRLWVVYYKVDHLGPVACTVTTSEPRS